MSSRRTDSRSMTAACTSSVVYDRMVFQNHEFNEDNFDLLRNCPMTTAWFRDIVVHCDRWNCLQQQWTFVVLKQKLTNTQRHRTPSVVIRMLTANTKIKTNAIHTKCQILKIEMSLVLCYALLLSKSDVLDSIVVCQCIYFDFDSSRKLDEEK